MKRIFRYATRECEVSGMNGSDSSDVETHVNLSLTACGHRTFATQAMFQVLSGDIFATLVRIGGCHMGYRIFAPRVGEERVWNEAIEMLLAKGYIRAVEQIETIKVHL